MSELYKSKDGYKIFLANLKVDATYRGLIIGSVEACSNNLLKDPDDFFTRKIGRKNQPLYIIKPEEFPLPQFYCIAELKSSKDVHSDDPDYNSYLYLCWFSNNTDFNIDTQIGNALKDINWKNSADDYDFTIF